MATPSEFSPLIQTEMERRSGSLREAGELRTQMGAEALTPLLPQQGIGGTFFGALLPAIATAISGQPGFLRKLILLL